MQPPHYNLSNYTILHFHRDRQTDREREGEGEKERKESNTGFLSDDFLPIKRIFKI
jgi:hypothetical protein